MINHIFIVYIYQPFFNILVGIYYLIGQLSGGYYDMGVAVIIFALTVRIILLPMDLSADRGEEEKRQIAHKLKEFENEYKNEPSRYKQERRRLLFQNPGAVLSEILSLVIQLIIILMLYRIFRTGLEGADLHLLYKFMPAVPQPINLMFLGQFDLSRTNPTLNLIQSLLIFSVEALNMLFSPLRTSRKEFLSLAIFLPVVSFIIFSMLPAGKKIFIITSLLFSVFYILIRQLFYHYRLLFTRPDVK